MQTRLLECYAEAAQKGSELLDLLQVQLSPRSLEQIDDLVGKREQFLAEARAVLNQTALTQAATSALQTLIEQQQVIEAEFVRIMSRLQQEASHSQVLRGNLGDLRSLLRPAPVAQVMNARR